MKNKLSKLLLVIIAVPIIVGVYIYFNKEVVDDAEYQNHSVTPTPLEYEYKALVPVVNFTNIKSSYMAEEIKKDNLYSLAINADRLPTEYADIEMIEEIDISTYLQQGAIILLTPEQVKPSYKTINVDGQNFWQKDFVLDDYPFKNLVLKSAGDVDTESSNKTVFFASGEIIPARAVDRLGFNKYGDHGYVYDFFKADMDNADISIALLENALLGNPTPCTGCMSFIGDDQAATGIANAGFDFLSCAGNHAGDAGQKAYENTSNLFAKLDVQLTGVGKTANEVMTPAIKEIDGRRIGMLGADDVAFYYWDSVTNDSTYGTNSFSKRIDGRLSIDFDSVAKIEKVKESYDIDYLIIYMSWGVEYTNYPTSHQKELGHALIDNGADIIIGSHPHWVQSVEFYNEKPIIYGLGNFIFDQTHTLPTRQGVSVNIFYYGGDVKNIEFMPHQTCGQFQTWNNVTGDYLNGEISLDEVYDLDENKACVFFQPKKLKEGDPRYEQILERIFEYTEINYE